MIVGKVDEDCGATCNIEEPSNGLDIGPTLCQSWIHLHFLSAWPLEPRDTGETCLLDVYTNAVLQEAATSSEGGEVVEVWGRRNGFLQKLGRKIIAL